ncbi:MAG: hypothetical protein COB02_17525 [Candidatus Cloacimonadota bacterium]|nr:MAG: hypothetical protein COB02_17525 [Candidatus Cloacimonadota bacterium]
MYVIIFGALSRQIVAKSENAQVNIYGAHLGKFGLQRIVNYKNNYYDCLFYINVLDRLPNLISAFGQITQ